MRKNVCSELSYPSLCSCHEQRRGYTTTEYCYFNNFFLFPCRYARHILHLATLQFLFCSVCTRMEATRTHLRRYCFVELYTKLRNRYTIMSSDSPSRLYRSGYRPPRHLFCRTYIHFHSFGVYCAAIGANANCGNCCPLCWREFRRIVMFFRFFCS